ncbi:MAG: PxKF domain-containing protein [Actinomycetota bacterium]|nr:PxKF domain-containing protein [Actinomycetota bacterium]
MPLGDVDLTMTQTTPTSFLIGSTLGVGDVVRVTVDGVTKDLVVEPLSIEWIVSGTDEVHGLALDGRTVEVTANPGPGGRTLTVVATGGAWTVDFTGVFDIQEQDPSRPAPPAAQVNARIVETGPLADGDALSDGRTANTPVVNVYPNCCGGQAIVQTGGWRSGTLVTLDVLRGTTTLLHKTVTFTGFPQLTNTNELAPLQIGDVVRVSAFGLTKEVTVVPLTITSVNATTDTVTGTAPAGATGDVTVIVPNVPGPSPAIVMLTANGSGQWTASFAPFDLLPTHQVSARVIDPERDSVAMLFFPPPPDLMVVTPDTGLVDGQQVQLTAAGWPTTAGSPGRTLFVTQCAIGDSGSDRSCDPTTQRSYALNPDGSLPPVQFTVKETLNITWPSNPTAWSCTTSPCGLRGAVYPNDDPTQPWQTMDLPGQNPVNFGQQPPQSGDIVVTPNTGLVDGQQVQLTATGWPTTAGSPGRTLFVTQCAIGDGGSNQSCDPTTQRAYPLNPDGSLPPVQFTVKETLNITWPNNPTAWSCTTSPNGCGLRGAVYPNDDPTQPWQMMELPSQNTVNFGQPPPQASLGLVPDTGLVDGQLIQLTATGWPASRTLYVTQCRTDIGLSLEACAPATQVIYTLQPDGTLPAGSTFSVARQLATGSGPVDCGVTPCGLVGVVWPGEPMVGYPIALDDPSNNPIQFASEFDFAGFFSPVDNPPVRNRVKAGSAIPVRFSLGGDQGLDIFAAGYPTSRAIACDTQAPSDAIESTIAIAGKSVLTYDARTDRYQFVWKTDKAWRGCRQLTVKLNDGTTHVAIFDFR